MLIWQFVGRTSIATTPNAAGLNMLHSDCQASPLSQPPALRYSSNDLLCEPDHALIGRSRG